MRGVRSLALALSAALLATGAFSSVGQAAPALPLGHSGRWVTDARGRVVIVHGINMVYKVPPYYPQAIGFGNDDGAFLQRIGFNAVRVGVIWKALEPRPGVYDDRYLNHIAQTVATLARHGVLSLLDFHQDMYNEKFQGEGAPDWAVQDDGLPAVPRNGFPANYETMPALQHAYDHFWSNSPGPGGVGLDDRYAAAWRHVAMRFRHNPAVLGYELFNEPFPGTPYLTCLAPAGCPVFDAKLTAFNRKVARAIRSVDRHTLIFYEPNVLFDFGFVTDVGALGVRDAGFAFHDYCFNASPNGCPSEAQGFANALGHVARTREALLLTEFGSNPFRADLSGMVRLADANMVPWMEWSFCPCNDPTGATPDPLVLDPAKPPRDGNLGSLALQTLVEPYPQVIAGTPRSWVFNAATMTFRLRYGTARASGHGRFPAGSATEIAVPRRIYPRHYAVTVTGGAILSAPGAGTLVIASCPGAQTVSVTVRPSGPSRASCRAPGS
jgi:endoglycosylceramidase